MRNDVDVNGGIAQIIPEPSYIIQISFFFTPLPPSSFICYHCFVLWRSPLLASQLKQIWFLFLYVRVTSLLLRDVCAGIGTGIKSPVTAKKARLQRTWACMPGCDCRLAFIFCLWFSLFRMVFVFGAATIWLFDIYIFFCFSLCVVLAAKHLVRHIQCLAKVFIPIELFHLLSRLL